MNSALHSLIRDHRLWQAGRPHTAMAATGLPTGYPELDQRLVWHGWPVVGLIEVCSEPGQGEVSLFLPALRTRSEQKSGLMLWVTPPFRPYAPALLNAGLDLSRQWVIPGAKATDALWAAEQALRSGLCVQVLAWFRRLESAALRRLQLAAEADHCTVLLFRPADQLNQPSPATLRLRVKRLNQRLCVRICRQRGGLPQEIELEERQVNV